MMSHSAPVCFASNNGDLRKAIESAKSEIKALGYNCRFTAKWMAPAQDKKTSSQLVEFLRELHQENISISDLPHLIDDSSYGITDWANAYLVFRKQLTSSTRITASSILGYLNCCSEAVNNTSSFSSFSEVVNEMLATYGFEGNLFK